MSLRRSPELIALPLLLIILSLVMPAQGEPGLHIELGSFIPAVRPTPFNPCTPDLPLSPRVTPRAPRTFDFGGPELI